MNKKYILGSINILLTIILYIIFILPAIKLNIISRLNTIIITILFVIILLINIKTYTSKNINKYNIFQFISFLINIVLIFNIINIQNEYNYYTNIITNKYYYDTYYLYVQKKNPKYSNINKLSNKKIGIYSNEENIKYLVNENKINSEKYDKVDDLEYALTNGNIQGILINKKEYDYLSDDIKNKIKIIYKHKVKTEN